MGPSVPKESDPDPLSNKILMTFSALSCATVTASSNAVGTLPVPNAVIVTVTVAVEVSPLPSSIA